MPLVELELLTLPEHMNSLPNFIEVRVNRFLALCVHFVDRCLSFCTVSCGHCVVCSSAIYRFWSPLWYRQLFFLYEMIERLELIYMYQESINLMICFSSEYRSLLRCPSGYLRSVVDNGQTLGNRWAVECQWGRLKHKANFWFPSDRTSSSHAYHSIEQIYGNRCSFQKMEKSILSGNIIYFTLK